VPEVSTDAALVIAVSWQALKRAEHGDERTSLCDCAVMIVFAAFFIEATLNHFLDRAGKKEGLTPPPGEHEGLRSKLAWIYNSFLAESPIAEQRILATKLEEAFPGFEAIRRFRNGVSHGIIDRSAATLENAKRLRVAAKAIVNRLLEIARDNHIPINRAVEYQTAINGPES
jgi:hypothetical protein